MSSFLLTLSVFFMVFYLSGCGGGNPASVSGSREVIVFEKNNAIYAIAPDGSGERMVTIGRGPVLSPDGSKVVFRDGITGAPFNAIFMCNLNGTARRQILAGGVSPNWSPDGGHIVYRGTNGVDSKDDGLYLINSDGTEKKRLTSNKLDEYPSFTPDGQRISFYRNSIAGSGLYSIDLTGGYLGHDWSLDGTSLVYIKGAGGKYGATYNIFVKKAGSSESTQLTNGGSFKFVPSFSPEGKKVVFSDDVGSVVSVGAPGSKTVRNLYILDLETKEVRQLTTNGNSQNPDWGRY